MKYNIDSLAIQMGLHEIEICHRKELFEFGRDDVYNLKKIGNLINDEVDNIVNEFYDIQLANADIKLIIGDEETLKRLMTAQKAYVKSLVSGDYGVGYVNDRLRIGKVHKRIGVSPKLYMSSMRLLRKLLVNIIEKEDPEKKCALIVSSLDKLLAFDTALVFETYTLSLTMDLENSREKVEQYAKSLESIIKDRTEELAELSLKDPLTELPNRRALSEFLKRRFASASRYNEAMSIIYFDVDHFKTLNDNHGHKEGDKLLVLIGSLLSENVRSCDIACRMGGDEFCVVLGKCDAQSALVFAERLVSDFEHKTHNEWSASISVGVYTCVAESNVSESKAFKCADQAMYDAKKRSGNAIVIYTED